jgi:hypothetical protein
MFRVDPELGWGWIPSNSGTIQHADYTAQRIEVNADGFRDDDFAPEDRASPRILVIGDSFVANVGVPSDDVFSEQLEARLPGVRVMNLGVSGYGMVQEALLLPRILDRYRADLILLQIYVRNDFSDNVRSRWPEDTGWLTRPSAELDGDGALRIAPAPPAAPERRPQRSSVHLDHFLRRSVWRVRFWLMPEADPDAALRYTPPELALCRRDPSDETRRQYEIAGALMQRVAALAAERGVPLGFVVAPSIVQVDSQLRQRVVDEFQVQLDRCDFERPQQVLRAVADRGGYALLDLLPVLQARHDAERPLYRELEQHWTPEANRVVAEAYREFIAQEFEQLELSGRGR